MKNRGEIQMSVNTKRERGLLMTPRVLGTDKGKHKIICLGFLQNKLISHTFQTYSLFNSKAW